MHKMKVKPYFWVVYLILYSHTMAELLKMMGSQLFLIIIVNLELYIFGENFNV